MAHKVSLQTEFKIPDDMGEENVRNILNEFFGDLCETDRFITADIVDDPSLDESESDRLLKMLSNIEDDDLKQLESFIDEYTNQNT